MTFLAKTRPAGPDTQQDTVEHWVCCRTPDGVVGARTLCGTVDRTPVVGLPEIFGPEDCVVCAHLLQQTPHCYEGEPCPFDRSAQ